MQFKEQKRSGLGGGGAHNLSGYLSEDTIVALTTAVGGPIVILRLSGNKAFSVFEKICGLEKITQQKPRALFRAKIQSQDGACIDDALAVYFPRPHSFTGEDVVELHLHGSAAVTTAVFFELFTLGVRQALPGEFSFRAVKNGKMSLSQSQGVADLISSTNQGATALALEKMSGLMNPLLSELAHEMRELVALSALGIDFSDQDVEEVSLLNLKKRVFELKEKITRLKNSFERGEKIQEGVNVGFLGLPNAGKSSFFNALLGADRAIVSEIAGTTRDVVREKITLHGKTTSLTLRLHDTAGLRESLDSVEKKGVEKTRQVGREADLVLLIVDVTAPIDRLWEEWEKMGRPAVKALGIFTKCDLVEGKETGHIKSELEKFNIATWVETSAKTGAGISEAGDAIVLFCEKLVSRKPGEILLTRVDQLQAVESCLSYLEQAEKATESDLFAADLRCALSSLNLLIGETLTDDILGRIFSQFCIGK